MTRTIDFSPRHELPADTLIVTGGDAVYFPMIEELHQSILDSAPGEAVAFGVIDGGLTQAQIACLQNRGATVTPLPDLKGFPIAEMRKLPHATVNLAKPWLDQMFPG